jgi:hypothetical protein
VTILRPAVVKSKFGDNAYEAWSEAQTKDGWVTMFRMTMKQSSP